jgi:hypothetical protein
MSKSPARNRKPRKNRSTNKSAAVRDYLAQNRVAGPTEVAAALTKQGVKITPAYVSTIKGLLKKAGSNGKALGTKRRGRPARQHSAEDAVSLSSLLEARRFAESVGGVEKASALLQSLSRLLA